VIIACQCPTLNYNTPTTYEYVLLFCFVLFCYCFFYFFYLLGRGDGGYAILSKAVIWRHLFCLRRCMGRSDFAPFIPRSTDCFHTCNSGDVRLKKTKCSTQYQSSMIKCATLSGARPIVSRILSPVNYHLGINIA